MDEQTLLLREIRDLLRLIAEPALAKRDETLRNALVTIVGKSVKRGKAILQMDGSRNQRAIQVTSGIDQGDLSRLVKSLRAERLLSDAENPTLLISVPASLLPEGSA